MLQSTLQALLKMCDDFLGDRAGINIDCFGKKYPAYWYFFPKVCVERHVFSASACRF